MAVRIQMQPYHICAPHVCLLLCRYTLLASLKPGLRRRLQPQQFILELPIIVFRVAQSQLFFFSPRDELVGLRSGPAYWEKYGFRVWLLHQYLSLAFFISLKEFLQECIISPQGFLAKDLQAEALCKLDRKVKATIEQFMKILEEIDTLVSKYSPEKNQFPLTIFHVALFQ